MSKTGHTTLKVIKHVVGYALHLLHSPALSQASPDLKDILPSVAGVSYKEAEAAGRECRFFRSVCLRAAWTLQFDAMSSRFQKAACACDRLVGKVRFQLQCWKCAAGSFASQGPVASGAW